MPGFGVHVSFTQWSSKNRQRRYRWLLAACAAALALSVVPGAGAGAAFAQVAHAPRTTASLTRASGTTTTKQGLDPATSFCFAPKPAPTSITDDPVKPKCKPLPKSTVPNTTNPFVIGTPYPGWATPLAGSKWVGPQANGRDSNEGAPNWYVYDASFTFKGCAQLNGQALADNQVGVFLNGHLLAHQTSSSASGNFGGPPLSFTAGYSGGPAVVDFVVNDSSGPATGLDYSFKVKSLPAADCLTRASGTKTTKQGLDPATSFCFAPKPAPTSITNDPVKPKCKPLPKSTVPNTTNPFVIGTPYPGWATPLAGSKWVGPQANGRDSNEGAPHWYIYDASFTFKGCAQLNGQALADNQVAVFLNGNLLANHQTSSSAPGNFGGPPLLFTAVFSGGTAVVDFVVNDSSGPATGLDYSFTVTSLPASACQPVTTRSDVLTISKAGGTAVKTGAVLTTSLAKGSSAVFSLGPITLTCKSASFTAKVTKNPAAKGTATESVTSQTTSNCKVTGVGGITVKSIKATNLPYDASVSDSTGNPVTVSGTSKTKPVETSVAGSVAGSSFSCVYQATTLKGSASNKGNSITFTKQKFTFASGSDTCPKSANFSAAFGPVKDTSVHGSPAVFVS